MKSPAQQIKKAAAKREKSYTNTRDRRLYPPYNIVLPNMGCRRIAFGLHWRCASCLLDTIPFRTSQLEWENNGMKQTPFQAANKTTETTTYMKWDQMPRSKNEPWQTSPETNRKYTDMHKARHTIKLVLEEKKSFRPLRNTTIPSIITYGAALRIGAFNRLAGRHGSVGN